MTIDPIKLIAQYQANVPVDVYGLIAAFGIPLLRRLLPEDQSGYIELQQDGKYRIVINGAHHPNRQRFTAAHELGHYIYHRGLLGRGAGDTRAYRSEGTPLHNVKITREHERQANSFAANLLMPREHLLNVDGVSTADLAMRFGVSADAMKIRLGRAD